MSSVKAMAEAGRRRSSLSTHAQTAVIAPTVIIQPSAADHSQGAGIPHERGGTHTPPTRSALTHPLHPPNTTTTSDPSQTVDRG